jgi:SAM-dependent methyltransferase
MKSPYGPRKAAAMTHGTFSLLLQVILLVVLWLFAVRQCRRPVGLLGNLVLRDMNRRHSEVTSWGLNHIGIQRTHTVLDVGCGGGRTIQKLAIMADQGFVYGVDYSQAAVSRSSVLNRNGIDSGQVDVRLASVSHLPFGDGMFDLVTAVETHYYWPHPARDLREIHRVLKPGGRVILIAEAYRGRSFDIAYRISMKLLGGAYLRPREHATLLEGAGFEEPQVFLETSKGWICAVGRRVDDSGSSAKSS